MKADEFSYCVEFAFTFQRRTSPFLHPVARDVPSGLNATTATRSGCCIAASSFQHTNSVKRGTDGLSGMQRIRQKYPICRRRLLSVP